MYNNITGSEYLTGGIDVFGKVTGYFGSQENGYFHKFATCVLESMDVSYGGDQFSSFRDGSPTEINMSLTFRELEILTKKMIEEGY